MFTYVGGHWSCPLTAKRNARFCRRRHAGFRVCARRIWYRSQTRSGSRLDVETMAAHVPESPQ